MSDKDTVKQKTDIVELIRRDVTLTKAGAHYKGLCPFHDEKTPSFFVNPELGIYKCFGCNKSGDVFTWLEETDGLTFSEALQELAKRAGVKLTQFKPDPAASQRQQILTALSLAKEFYHWLLTQHRAGERALQYTKERGIKSQTIKEFHIGFSPPEWDGLLKYLTIKKKLPLAVLLQAGLVISRQSGSGAYDRFRGRLMFPLQNPRGQTLGFSGRVIPDLTPGEDKTGKYINSPETDVYHKRELLFGLEITKADIKKKNLAIVVEGELDVISSWQAGVQNIVAIKGSALTDEQIRILKRYTDRLALALDTDLAGDLAARRGITAAQAAGLQVSVITLPQGKDPDELAQRDPAAWKKAAKNHTDIYQFFLNSSLNRYDSGTANGKQKIAGELLPILAQIPSPIIQSHWISELAKSLNLKEELLINEMRRGTSFQVRKVAPPSLPKRGEGGSLINNKINKSPATNPQTPATRRTRLEQLLLAHYLQTDLPALLQTETAELFITPWITRLIKLLRQQIENRKSKIENLQMSELDLPEELRSVVAQTLMLPEYEKQHKLKINIIIKELKTFQLKDQLKQLRAQITRLEKSGEENELLQAQQQFSALTSTLAKLGH